MRHAELEQKVLAIIDRVALHQAVEGSNLELKAKWPESKGKAARQLAGMCNASRGDPVLWIIGLDEDNGLVGAPKEELANWWPMVEEEFDREAPAMTLSLSVRSGEHTVVALYFETSRAPYVVRNPDFGKGPGSIEFEVPWREGTKTRSARREDLIRMLVPVVRTPEFELLDCRAKYYETEAGPWAVRLDFSVYAVVRSPVVAVARRSLVTVTPNHMSPLPMNLAGGFGDPRRSERTEDAHLDRSSTFHFNIVGPIAGVGPSFPSAIQCSVAFGLIDLEKPAALSARLVRMPQYNGIVFKPQA